jgi:4-amino-4-deoxy-L-arabinose transferase-like glycosyltransferase
VATSPSTTPGVFRDWTLPSLVVLAAAFRVFRLDADLIDAHSWRQVTNADIARHFAETTWNLLTPRVSWGGPDGVVGMEFPLLHYGTGMVWRLFDESAMTARLVSVAFSLVGVPCLFYLGRDLHSRSAGCMAAFLLAVSPSCVFFGRSFLSDSPMLTLSIAAVLAWHRALAAPGRWRLFLATATTALAGLVKLPAVIVGLPIGLLAWKHRGSGMLRDSSVLTGGIVSVALIALWYWYADLLAARTGLTQAVFRASGTYGIDVGLALEAYATVSHWSSTARLTDSMFYLEMLDRFWGLHLSALGFCGAVLGWWVARGRPYTAVIDAWMLAGLALFLATAEGQYWHEFHQLPLLPPLFLYFGIGAGAVVDALRPRLSKVGTAGAVTCLVALSVMSFRDSNVILHFYRPDNLQTIFPGVGASIREATEPSGLLITVDYAVSGTNSPMTLYYSRRHGWSFDVHAIAVSVIEHLQTRGARYFVTMEWPTLGRNKPDVALYLQQHKPVALAGAPGGVRMFDLRQRIAP